MIAIEKLDAAVFEAWVFPTTSIARPGLPARTLGGLPYVGYSRFIKLADECLPAEFQPRNDRGIRTDQTGSNHLFPQAGRCPRR